MSDFSLALCKKIGTVSIHKTMLFRSPSRSKLSISICIFRKACFVSYAFPHALQPFVNVIFRNLVKCFIVKSARRIRQIMLWDLRKIFTEKWKCCLYDLSGFYDQGTPGV